jgi:hypothetical protein
MGTFTQKSRESKGRAITDGAARKESSVDQSLQRADERPAAVAHQALEQSLNQSDKVQTQLRLQQSLNESPRVVAQMKLAATLSGHQSETQSQQPVQRQDALEDEELTQRQASLEDEEPLQGKLEAVQREEMAEEEPLQAKQAPLQREEMEEDEPLQSKAQPVQREAMAEEEEPLQPKLESAQRQAMAEDEEPLQGRFGTVQKKENQTGLPDSLKAGVENLSGLSMDDVKVHYNSSAPEQVQALAYTQGSEIHVGPGQEKHLAHEAWHVAQQKQGRVQPTMQARGVSINDDQGLEREADVMGQNASRVAEVDSRTERNKPSGLVQGKFSRAPLIRNTPSSDAGPQSSTKAAAPVVQRADPDVLEWADLLTGDVDFEGHPFETELTQIREIINKIGAEKVRAYLREELGIGEGAEIGEQLNQMLTNPLEGIRQAILSSDVDVDKIFEAMQAFGLPVTKNIVKAVKSYNYNSEWINFTPDNFLSWIKLATGQGNIRDAQYLIHEAIEIGAILNSGTGLDPFMTPEEYGELEGEESDRLSDVFGGGEDGGGGLYATSHLRALEYEYKFVAIQIHSLTGLAYSYLDVAAADPDRSEARDKLMAPNSEETLGEDEQYANVGENVVDLSPQKRELLGFEEGAVTLSDLVRAVKGYKIAQLMQRKTVDNSHAPIQRQINWVSGDIRYDNNLAEGMVVNRPYIGFTDPTINGESMTRGQDFMMKYDLPAPKILSQEIVPKKVVEEEPKKSESSKSDESENSKSDDEFEGWGTGAVSGGEESDEDQPVTVKALMAIDKVPVVNLGYIMHLPTMDAWTVTASKEEVAAAIKRYDNKLDTSGLAERVTLVVKGEPSDTQFLIHVLNHEFEHVFITLDYIYDYLWDFDRKMEAVKNQPVEVTAVSFELTDEYWMKVIGMGGYEFLSDFHKKLSAAQDTFHKTPEGSYPKPKVTILAADRVLITLGGH